MKLTGRCDKIRWTKYTRRNTSQFNTIQFNSSTKYSLQKQTENWSYLQNIFNLRVGFIAVFNWTAFLLFLPFLCLINWQVRLYVKQEVKNADYNHTERSGSRAAVPCDTGLTYTGSTTSIKWNQYLSEAPLYYSLWAAGAPQRLRVWIVCCSGRVCVWRSPPCVHTAHIPAAALSALSKHEAGDS